MSGNTHIILFFRKAGKLTSLFSKELYYLNTSNKTISNTILIFLKTYWNAFHKLDYKH